MMGIRTELIETPVNRLQSTKYLPFNLGILGTPMLRLYGAGEDCRRKGLNTVWCFEIDTKIQEVYRQGRVRRGHDDVWRLAVSHIADDSCYRQLILVDAQW